MSYLEIEFPLFLFSMIANVSLAIVVFRYAERKPYRINLRFVRSSPALLDSRQLYGVLDS